MPELQNRFVDLLPPLIPEVAAAEIELAPDWLIRRRVDAVVTYRDGSSRILEFGERQHFTGERALTLRYYDSVQVAFDIGAWRRRSQCLAGREPGGGFSRWSTAGYRRHAFRTCRRDPFWEAPPHHRRRGVAEHGACSLERRRLRLHHDACRTGPTHRLNARVWWFDSPVRDRFESVVMSAQVHEVRRCGGAAVLPLGDMVDIAIRCGTTAASEATRPIAVTQGTA